MSTRFDCLRWLALLLSAAALMVLAPRPASAHSGHDQGSGSVSQPAGDSIAVNGVSPAMHGWSQSCPGSPGNACCCDGLTAFPGGGKIALVNAGGWVVFVSMSARAWTGGFPRSEPLTLFPPSNALPRAPPFFS